MANRYWVGGTASWDGTAGTKWALTSGGAGGQAVPTSADDVFFDAASGAVTVTIAAGNTGAKSINCTGFTGTLAGSTAISVAGNVTLVAGMTWTYAGTITVTGAATITSAGKTWTGAGVNVTAPGFTVVLGDAYTSTAGFIVTSGTFTTNNYAVTAQSLTSNSTNTRTINLGSSTVTLSGTGSVAQFSTTTGLTFNAGTSTIVLSSATSPNLNVAATGLTFYDVNFTGANATQQQVSGANTFRNLTVAGRTSAGIKPFIVDSNQTISGTLTLSAGTNATMRTFVQSDTIGTTRTLTCAAVSATDIDFRDITIAGAAAPVSGTRLGDAKGNSGVTFPAAKTVYPTGSFTSGNWGAGIWSTTAGGAQTTTDFPLAQDTVVVTSTVPNTGGTISLNANYNIGTIDMSARTSNTMTLATGGQTPAIYGNWINGTGITLTGTGLMTFAGRGSQTITSAGKTFTQAFTVDSPSGSVTLQDAFTTNRTIAGALTLTSGTFDASTYNVTLSGSASSFVGSGSNTRTIAIGSGTWTIAGSATGNIAWSTPTTTNLTVTGTGTISLTSASAKTFVGGNIQTYPTLNQGGAGTLTVTGSNKFANITNTYSATGATTVLFTAGTTTTFSAFNLTGTVGKVCTFGSTTTTQITVIKPSTWYMGANSTNVAGNTNLVFTAGGGIDYLSVGYVNGTVVVPPSTYSGNFFAFF